MSGSWLRRFLLPSQRILLSLRPKLRHFELTRLTAVVLSTELFPVKLVRPLLA